jgi:hypothetical protein
MDDGGGARVGRGEPPRIGSDTGLKAVSGIQSFSSGINGTELGVYGGESGPVGKPFGKALLRNSSATASR